MIGIVLQGRLKNVKIDYNGNQSIIVVLNTGEMFAETLVCAEIKKSPVTVIALEDSEILFFNFKKILGDCKNACSFHSILIGNMVKIMAVKNLYLNQKLEHVTKRTIREKLLVY